MGRSLRINWRESESVLEERWKSERDVHRRERLHALWLVRQGHSLTEVHRLLKKRYVTIHSWVKIYREDGLEELLRRTPGHNGKGKPSLVSPEDITRILDYAQHTGFQSSAHAQKWIEEHLGASYKESSVKTLFRRLGVTWKLPRPQHEKQEEGAVEAFKKGDLLPLSPRRVWSWEPA